MSYPSARTFADCTSTIFSIISSAGDNGCRFSTLLDNGWTWTTSRISREPKRSKLQRVRRLEIMISACSFIDHLHGLGYSQYAGVPCSFLTSLINYVISNPALDYVGATSEGEAVGITFGAFLAGRKTVIMCQNSGLGNMVNPFTSLNYPFRVPTLLIVTWRGEPGVRDEPQHEQMGRIMHRLLDTLEIPWLPFPTEDSDISEIIEKSEQSMSARQLPFALVMSKGPVPDCQLTSRIEPERVTTELRDFSAGGTRSGASVKRGHDGACPSNERLTRMQALELILDTLNGDEALIATTGKTGRELF